MSLTSVPMKREVPETLCELLDRLAAEARAGTLESVVLMATFEGPEDVDDVISASWNRSESSLLSLAEARVLEHAMLEAVLSDDA